MEKKSHFYKAFEKCSIVLDNFEIVEGALCKIPKVFMPLMPTNFELNSQQCKYINLPVSFGSVYCDIMSDDVICAAAFPVDGDCFNGWLLGEYNIDVAVDVSC